MDTKNDVIGSVEAARLLGISRKTIVNYVKDGRIPALRLPKGMYRYDKKTIERIAKEWNTQRVTRQ